jgi:hypothetical protein
MRILSRLLRGVTAGGRRTGTAGMGATRGRARTTTAGASGAGSLLRRFLR